MNIIKKIDQYNENYLYFCDPIKNNIMNDGKFIRILYSSHYFILNGIYLYIPLHEISIEKYYNKYKCNFNVYDHRDTIESIKTIEENILKQVNIKNKTPMNKIYEQLKNGNIKIFTNELSYKPCNNAFILKISGVWETELHYGVTYKFSKINNG
jgi:cytochrome c biogenesis protein ResB